MARIRTIKPDFWRDEDLSKVSAEAALLAIGLLNHADDEGYFNANAKLVESDVFPLRELSGSTTALMEELRGIGYITVFSGSDGKRYAKISNFDKHQVINKKSRSKIKDLCQLPEDYRSPTVSLPTGMEGNGKGREVEQPPRKRDAPTQVSKPDDVDQQTWIDWVALRKAKRSTVSETVVKGARQEAAKAGLTLDDFLQVWCRRGSQGLEADWLKPNDRQSLSTASPFAGAI